MKKYFITYMIMLLCNISGMANTTRELGKAPDYNWDRIKKLVILYLNLERINNSKPALVIIKNLNSAAQWHADYMSDREQLFHVADKKGMHDVQQRIEFFGEKISSYGEIIGSTYSLSAEGIAFVKKKDKNGEFVDFGKNTVYWLNETQIATSLARTMLNNPAYLKCLLYEPFNSIGGGVSTGNRDGIKAWYGSLALAEKREVIKLKLKMSHKKDVIKKKKDGKEVEETIVKLSFSGFTGKKAALLAINRSGAIKTFDSEVQNGRFDFTIDDEFRAKLSDDDKLYVASYDEENDTYYPVLRVEVIK